MEEQRRIAEERMKMEQEERERKQKELDMVLGKKNSRPKLSFNLNMK